MAAPSQASNVVICGGGIMGASIAYFLSERGVPSTVIERSQVAAAASGKAGGFLARGWGSGCTSQLHEVSYDLHEKLAKELGVEGYRKLPTLSVQGGKRSSVVEKAVSSGKAPSWLDGAVAKASLMDDATAQTNPLELTTKLMDAAVKKGAKVLHGKVEGVRMEGGTVSAVVVDGADVPTDCMVVAMGPWSCMAEDWFPALTLPMEGVRSTSIVFKTDHDVDPFALFCGEDANGCHLEVYPRNSNEVYMCGIGGSKYLQNAELKAISPEEITADPSRVAAASRSFGAMSSLGAKAPDVTQACMRPCPPDAMPYMGRIPGASNAFLAAGHNCWGILWGPVTGLAMSELILDGKAKCVDLAPFDPSRFCKDAKGGRGRKQ
eukprot:CAMPEP_0181291678 /NCGR_PEP_ID=MMETSP1101-20121128/2098_1 /TAXON_ID=46948 /ORGANISM="Rhodomonas abbreviata, Strain Caron Lab Isolate" /LENGTH=377 /DNA_ID=CAMNT_0023396091 /DNA_START=159 /DNA_END=1289 /DNA_ORIENTATION=-